eukprot:CAMPEP_0181200042 /NCGR_PEP_ID=MMETSP1096-20121128/17530_1 /TAXON_ID=156174 ORGANISM="Chrysochromulina ericina, Strain CCMP281" /NCGR_SAMPLE_ID=MMETSP1096 /ASSEMBLY_ACC=CAM_ASM_000453 /LENGTH=70 /DNA_ID=CAMNT_0023290327 /DNA_START=123 /DNA_END=335 /DNA_ORIENTATION=+
MTYAMTLADLDAEFRRAVSKSSGSIKVDKRLHFEGFLDVQMPNEKLIHVMMDYAGPQTTICQLKYWVDFH